MKLRLEYTVSVTVNEDANQKTEDRLKDFVKTLGSDTSVDETDREELEDEDEV